jgi:hypothetical protein
MTELEKKITDIRFAIAMESDPYIVGCLENELKKLDAEE